MSIDNSKEVPSLSNKKGFKDFLNERDVSPLNEQYKIYISGPMTGYVDYNIPLFNFVANILEKCNIKNVINPGNFISPDYTWEDYIKKDIKLIIDEGVNVLLLLPGWRKSRGSTAEVYMARLLKAEIYEFNESGLQNLQNKSYWDEWREALGAIDDSTAENFSSLLWLLSECTFESSDLIYENATDKPAEVKANAEAKDECEENLPNDIGILAEAEYAVNGPRKSTYGNPKDNWERTAKMFSVICKTEVTPSQAALCLIATKICRHIHKAKRDNLVDIAGYAHIVSLLDE